MNILIVGNILNDVYLNLDPRTERLETDKHGVKWLNLSFDASEHHFFSKNNSLGGAAVTLEVLTKLGLNAAVNNFDLHFTEDGPTFTTPIETSRYILISNENICYLAPSTFKNTSFATPTTEYDYLYIDRSASLNQSTVNNINSYLDTSPNTKLVLYIRNPHEPSHPCY